MRVAEVMTSNVQVASPDQSIVDVARLMADCDCGSLPVGENDRLIGMITDRDIVIRAVAQGKESTTKVRDIMTESLEYCFEDDDVQDVAHKMGDLQVRRLPVISQGKRLVGIVTLGGIARTKDMQSAAEALSSISQPTSPHASSEQRPH